MTAQFASDRGPAPPVLMGFDGRGQNRGRDFPRSAGVYASPCFSNGPQRIRGARGQLRGGGLVDQLGDGDVRGGGLEQLERNDRVTEPMILPSCV